MNIGKYFFPIIVIFCIHTTTYAQNPNPTIKWGWDWTDTARVNIKDLPQLDSYIERSFPYPPIPRSQWELGLDVGYNVMVSDVKPRAGFGLGLSARHALNHNWSYRFGYHFSQANGQDVNFSYNGQGIWAQYGSNGYIANYTNTEHQFSFDMIYSLNPQSFYRANPKWNWYVFAGYTLFVASVNVDALDANEKPYEYTNPDVFSGSSMTRRDAIRATQDKVYESNMLSKANNIINVGNMGLRHGLDFGVGFAYKLSPKFSVGFEQRFLATFTNDLNGMGGVNQQGIKANATNTFSYSALKVTMNIGRKTRRTQPLWWLNAYNFLYREINRPQHLKKQSIVLLDSDKDGVTNQFDLQPNTPIGASVDTHGVALDTDGDGVPDFMDQEIVTLKKCFPVDKDGIGQCPEPPCCTTLRKLETQTNTLQVRLDSLQKIIDTVVIEKHDTIRTIQKEVRRETIKQSDVITLDRVAVGVPIILRNVLFPTNSYDLDSLDKIEIDKVYKIMLEKPTIQLQVAGHTDNIGTRQDNYVLSTNRALAIVYYLESLGIDSSRFSYKGYADMDPIADNSNDEGRALNRRIECTITSW